MYIYAYVYAGRFTKGENCKVPIAQIVIVF